MNELVVHSLYLLSGIVAYAAVQHFAYAISPPRNSMQMLFAGICVLAALFTLILAGTFQATSVAEFAGLMKWNIAAILLFLILFSWFIALYTGIQPRLFLISLTVLFVVLFVVNLAQPYSLQYDHIEGLRTLHLPWGETVARAIGHHGPWIYIGSIGAIITFSYGLYASCRMYYRYRRRADLWMALSVGLFFLGAIEAILARLSAIDFIELGPFTLMVMVLVMGAALTSEMQQRLRKSEQDFRSLFENSPTAMVAIEPDSGRIIQANNIALQLTGYNATEIQTVTVAEQTHTDDQAESKQRYEQLSSGIADHVYFEKRYRRKDGSIFFGYSSISAIKDDHGRVTRFIGSTIDISERKQTENALRENEEKLRSLYELSPLGIALTDMNGRYVEFNESFKKICGYPEDELKVLDYWTLTPKKYEADEARQLELLERTGRYGPYEKEYVRKDGSLIPLRLNGVLVTGRDGQKYIWSIVEDITEHKQAETALRESEEKLQAVLNASEVAIAWATEDGRIEYINPKFSSLFGYTLDDVPTIEQWYLHAYPDPTYRAKIVAEWDAKIDQSIAARTAIESMEADITCMTGSICHVLLMGSWAGTRLLVNFSDITERKHMEDALRDSEMRFRTVIKHAPIGISFARSGVNIDMNLVCLKMFGCDDLADMYGQPLINFIAPRSRPEAEYRIQQRLQGNPIDTPLEIYGLRKDGSEFPMYVSTKSVLLEDGPITVGFLIDISDRRQAEAELRIAATAFESQEGMLITDPDSVILRVNQAFTAITGYPAEEAIGKTPRMLRSGQHDANYYAAMWQDLNNTGAWEGEIWNRRKNGEVYPEHLSITAVKDQNGIITNYVATFTDITQRKKAEEDIQHLAFYDQLTDLPNRRLLLDRLQQASALSSRSGRQGALLFIDLDDFKSLNDTLGHATGDILLQQVARRLTDSIREGDSVARLGGDEFVVILEGLSEDLIEAAEQTEAICNKILVALNQPYQLGTHVYHCTTSIGATLFKDHRQSIDELYKQADIAMYQAKKDGRNTMRFFDPQMQDNINTRAAMEHELRKALENRQFHLHFQIQVDNSRHPLGAEALIRWIHPERGLVSPAHFIPLAEETGLILPIGQWVLETACAQIKAWQHDERTRNLVLAVNISAKQFRQVDFVVQVQEAVQRNSINPKLLKLELTESMLLDDIEIIIVTMNALKAIGVRFSLDDFGTGYSSLQYLKRLPIDQLKIDQSFVRDIAIDSSDKEIVRTIIAMAQSLNLDVIAEGVETEEQQKFLLTNGCTNFQGYLFGKPMSIEQFEALLKRG